MKPPVANLTAPRSSTNQTVTDTVNAILADRGITYTDFARQMWWARSTAWRKLNAGAPWTMEDVDRAALVLDVDPAALVLGTWTP